MKKSITVLLVAAIAISSIGLPLSPASAGDYHNGWSSERSWRGEHDRDRDYYRDRGRYRDRDRGYRHDNRSSNHKNRDTAIIAGIAGLALGAAIIGLSNQNSRAPNGDRLIYDPN